MMKNNNYHREKWADIVKALAIWMMVFCHANLSNEGVQNFIYIFHMPVFFIISGYFDKGETLSYRTFKKSLYSLIRPYFIYSLLSFSICWISPYLHPEIYPGIHGLLPTFRAAFWGMLLMDDTVTTYSFMPSGPLWSFVVLGGSLGGQIDLDVFCFVFPETILHGFSFVAFCASRDCVFSPQLLLFGFCHFSFAFLYTWFCSFSL